MSTKHNIIRIRRGTASEWANSEPQPDGEILKLGEPGYEKDTGKLKIGDGTTPWNNLPYFNDGAAIDPENLQDLIGNGFLVAGDGISIVYDDDGNSLTLSNTKQTYDAAVEWSANHTIADGTRYLAGDLVYYNGNLYRAKHDNESVHPTNDGEQSSIYWENVGGGYRLNIDGRDIQNIPYPVKSVNGQTGDVTISSGNPFDQDLNTTDFPTFSGVSLSKKPSLLLHFDNDFTDSGEYNLYVTPVNGATTSADQAKFGEYSLYCNGGYARIDDSSSLIFGNNDFTIECQIYIPLLNTPTTDTHTIFTHRMADNNNSGILLAIDKTTGNLYCFIANENNNWQISAANLGHTISEATWHHIALVKHGNELKAYVDGIGGTPLTVNYPIGASGPFNIGCGSDKENHTPIYGIQDFIGYIDEFIIYKNLAKYLSNFIPPSVSQNQSSLNIDGQGITFHDGSIQNTAFTGNIGTGTSINLYDPLLSYNQNDIVATVDLANNALSAKLWICTDASNAPIGEVPGVSSAWTIINTNDPIITSPTFNTSITIDATVGDMFDITLTDNITLENPTNPINGKTLRFRITQDGTGGRSVTLGSKFSIPSSASSPLPWSTAPNKMDILAATYHAVRDKWDIVAFVPGY